MPAKVQIKLLSNSGELLSVVACHAGRISVFRSSTPSDLRPYQRALAGSSAKDNLQIVVDGAEYHPDDHTLVGFGEPSPTTGLSVRDFLIKQNISELAIESLLLSIGLEDISNKLCSDITPEQEARLRLIAGTVDADKILVINDPFEQIASKWRERAAETLTNFARTRRALVIIPSLSYRPESWIENEIVDRIEVGQTSQRTIGFASANHNTNNVINQIRQQAQQDSRAPNNSANILSGTALGAGAVSHAEESILPKSRFLASSTLKTATVKIGGSLVGLTACAWIALSAGPIQSKVTRIWDGSKLFLSGLPSAPTPPKDSKSVGTKSDTHATMPEQQIKPPETKPKSDLVSRAVKPPAEKVAYILDQYPEQIKTSILDTVRGTNSYRQTGTTQQTSPLPPKQDNSGNLFSLLEKASAPKNSQPNSATNSATFDDESDSDAVPYDEDAENNEDITEEEQRREEIRNRFLEAIRASAEKRRIAAEERSLVD